MRISYILLIFSLLITLSLQQISTKPQRPTNNSTTSNTTTTNSTDNSTSLNITLSLNVTESVNSTNTTVTSSSTCNTQLCSQNNFANLTCLSTPIKSSNLSFCKQLTGKDICCSEESINNIGTVIRYLLGNFTQKAMEDDSSLNETQSDADLASSDMKEIDSTINNTNSQIENLDANTTDLSNSTNSAVSDNTTISVNATNSTNQTNSTVRRFLRSNKDSSSSSNTTESTVIFNSSVTSNSSVNTSSNTSTMTSTSTKKNNQNSNGNSNGNSNKAEKNTNSNSTQKQDKQVEREHKKESKNMIKSVLNLKNLNTGLLRKKLPVKDVHKYFVHFQQVRRKCFNFIFELASKFSCMACFNAQDQKQFFQNGTLILDQSVCSNISNKCADYIQNFANISQLIQNQQNIQKMYDLIKSLNHQIKNLRNQTTGNDINQTLVVSLAQNITDTYNQALQVYNTPFIYRRVSNQSCQSNKTCNYSCQQFISASTGGIDFDVVQSPGTLTVSRRVLPRELQTSVSSTTYISGGFNPQTSVTSGVESSINFQADPTKSNYSAKLFNCLMMLVILMSFLLFF